MPPQNLGITVFGRQVKPVAFVLMTTMFIIGAFSIADAGVLGESEWSDVLGGMGFTIGAVFLSAWWTRSQYIAEMALLGAFFVWGLRFWGIIFVQGAHSFRTEGFYLSLCWMLLAGGSWLLERADPRPETVVWGGTWTRP